jgi:uncharacterized protein (DUF2235 family)
LGKNIVVCCDGTGNEVEGNLSNVLKLFRIAQKNEGQIIFYKPGIGTIGSADNWTRLKQNTKSFFELVTGYGLDSEILDAYRFICKRFEPDDNIFLFGFSRGAYTARALAGFIHMVGLVPPDQLNVSSYALTAYKRSSEANDFSIAWNFSRVVGRSPSHDQTHRRLGYRRLGLSAEGRSRYPLSFDTAVHANEPQC